MEFLENRGAPEKIKAPRTSPEKWAFLPFTVHLVCTLLIIASEINFGTALHSLYRKYFVAEIILLYITLS